MKIYSASILVPAYGDCTNNGISKGKCLMTLFDECGKDEAIETCRERGIDSRDALYVDRSPSCGRPYIKAVPLFKKTGYIGPMFGGNYAVTHAIDAPIPIHDRFETPEEYEILSR